MIIESEKAVCDSFGSKTDDSDESKFIRYTFFDIFRIFRRFCGQFFGSICIFLNDSFFRRLYNNREQKNI